jgi:putative transposase
MGRVLTHCLRLKSFCLDILHLHFVRWMKPLTPSLPLGTLADLGKSKPQLVAENAFLRQQLIILSRQVKRPVYRKADRMLLVLLARLVRTWEQALLIVQPTHYCVGIVSSSVWSGSAGQRLLPTRRK